MITQSQQSTVPLRTRLGFRCVGQSSHPLGRHNRWDFDMNIENRTGSEVETVQFQFSFSLKSTNGEAAVSDSVIHIHFPISLIHRFWATQGGEPLRSLPSTGRKTGNILNFSRLF